jgi:hypothetical protein
MLVSDSKGQRTSIFSRLSHERATSEGLLPLLLHSIDIIHTLNICYLEPESGLQWL